MKNFTLLILFTLITFTGHSQTYKIRIGGAAGQEVDIENLSDSKFKEAIKTFEIKKDPGDAKKNVKKFKISSSNESEEFLTDGNYHTVTFTSDVRNGSLYISDDKGVSIGTPFKLLGSGAGTLVTDKDGATFEMPRDKTATNYIVNTLFKGEIKYHEGIGLKIKTSKNTGFIGNDYVHVFFDQNGNSLIRSIPIGIGRANYVAHVVYLTPSDNPLNIEYHINQVSADVDEGVNIRGDGGLNNNPITLAGIDKTTVKLEWKHYEILLEPSSYDVVFDIKRSEGFLENSDPKIVATRVIKMKKVYHGSIDIGVLKTDLENPDFALVTNPADPAQSVVKKTNAGSRILASAMYTFYFSPIVAIEKLFQSKKVSNYRLEGRTFVDDHKWYERIYPTVGVGLNDRLLDNVFVGGKWEFIRGGSVFAGYNWGKVNTLNVDENFEYESTAITQAEFDLKTNTKWDGAFCFGFNLDLRIITNLFRTGSDTTE